MAAYEYDSRVDGIEINGVRYICLDCPGRPQFEGKHPEGTIQSRQGYFNLHLAPETLVVMAV